jgi:hypothetical protein
MRGRRGVLLHPVQLCVAWCIALSCTTVRFSDGGCSSCCRAVLLGSAAVGRRHVAATGQLDREWGGQNGARPLGRVTSVVSSQRMEALGSQQHVAQAGDADRHQQTALCRPRFVQSSRSSEGERKGHLEGQINMWHNQRCIQASVVSLPALSLSRSPHRSSVLLRQSRFVRLEVARSRVGRP